MSEHDRDSLARKRLERDYGWLTQSALQPKKRTAIEGVSGSSIVELQATLYRTQEHVKLRQEGVIDPSDKHVRRRAGIDVGEIMGRRNAGVEARDARDKLQLKKEGDRSSEVYEALQRKSELYDKLVRGEVEDDEEQYEVDFFRKPDEARGAAGAHADDLPWRRGGGDDEGDDGRAAGPHDEWEAAAAARAAAAQEHQQRRQQYKEVVLDVAAHTAESRERAAALRTRKAAATAAKRARLKEAFLQKLRNQAQAQAQGQGQAQGQAGSA